MAKIIANNEYVDNGDVKQTGKYLFDAQDGSEVVELNVWLEKSKATEAHPDGKPWIILPNGNITNRKYFSEDKFIAEAVDGEIDVEIKTAAPRILGATGVKKEVLKYLDEAEAAEYTELVETTVEAFKAAKADRKAKKPEDMNEDELMAYIEALKTGTKFTLATGPKSFLDMFTEEQYERYNELLAISAENKANRPKAKRQPLTEEQKAARAAKRVARDINKAEALLAQLQGIAPEHVEEDEDEE